MCPIRPNFHPFSSILLWATTCALLLTAGVAVASTAFTPNGQDAPNPTERLPLSALELSAPPLGIPATANRAAKTPRLDATLAEVAFIAQSRRAVGQRLAESLARQGNLRLVDGRVQVQLTIAADARKIVTAAVEQAGGTVTGGMADGATHLLQAWLPLERLTTITALSDVLYVRRPMPLSPFDETPNGTVTEAMATMNAAAWQSSGRTGQGVRVGVIDGGFSGYQTLLGNELPAQVDVANFVDEESADAVDGTTRHGAAVAEIVHDIAPDARLSLAKIDTNVDLSEAVAWLIGQKVAVIVTSIGWYNLSPGDGTGAFADLVQTAADAGILWVTAAGNDRERHWGGLYTDPDNDGYHNFSQTQEVNFFGPGDGSTYLISSGQAVNIHVRWDDWLNVRSDYDLYLLRWTGSAWETVASSSNPQSGQSGQTPTETIHFVTDGPPAAYGFILSQHRGSPTQPINFEIFTPRFLRPSLTVASRSLPNLADAPAALTVAAVSIFSPYDHQSYSSEGPTNGPGGGASGGQVKPDLAAYTNVSTASYGVLNPFSGTSAAAPHAAGAAALVKAAYPQASPADLRAFLEGRALDVGTAGRDAQTGAGRLWLGTPPVNLAGSSMGVDAPDVSAGQPVTYTLRLRNAGGITATVSLENPLPATLRLIGLPQASDGSPVLVTGDLLQWDGAIGPGGSVVLDYSARLLAPLGGGVVRVVNGARITDDEARIYGISVSINPLQVYLPVVAAE